MPRCLARVKDRCLCRHGVAHLKRLMPVVADGSAVKKTFKDYVPGFVHIDIKYLPQLPDETHRRYRYVAMALGQPLATRPKPAARTCCAV